VDYSVMLLQQSIEHVSIVYTCNTYFFNTLVYVIYPRVSGQCSYTIPFPKINVFRGNYK